MGYYVAWNFGPATQRDAEEQLLRGMFATPEDAEKYIPDGSGRMIFVVKSTLTIKPTYSYKTEIISRFNYTENKWERMRPEYTEQHLKESREWTWADLYKKKEVKS